MSYVGANEEHEQESQLEPDDCLGMDDTVSSDVRALGDGLESREAPSDLTLAVVPDGRSVSLANISERALQETPEPTVSAAQRSPTEDDACVTRSLSSPLQGRRSQPIPPVHIQQQWLWSRTPLQGGV